MMRIIPFLAQIDQSTPFRLPQDKRYLRPKVLRSGDKWLACQEMNEFSLTDNISKALVFRFSAELQEVLSSFSKLPYVKTWPEPLRVEQLACTVYGLVTGSEPKEDFDAPFKPTWDSCDAYTLALAETANFEADQGEDDMMTHSSLLCMSPMWPLLLKRYDDEHAAEVQEPSKESSRNAIENLAVRMLYAGIVMGRLERGRKTVDGSLQFDSPGLELAKPERKRPLSAAA